MKLRKVLKGILIGLPILVILAVAFIVGSSYMEHRRLVEEEKAQYPAPGALVDVHGDGDQLHVYAAGDGDTTLVFLAGLGTASPVYDFQVLMEQFTEDYRVVVMERAGYGWSDTSATPRDTDTVLYETRTALELTGEEPPYVLFPHSLSGLEAIHWANLYPEELEGIVGLDPLVPEYVQVTDETPSLSRAVSVLVNTGLVRHQPEVFEQQFHAMRKGHLDEEQAAIARTLFFRRVQTENMWEEAEMVSTNADLVSQNGIPSVPFYAFISQDNDNEHWAESIRQYTAANGGEAVMLDGGHYIHLDAPEAIGEKVRTFLEP